MLSPATAATRSTSMGIDALLITFEVMPFHHSAPPEAALSLGGDAAAPAPPAGPAGSDTVCGQSGSAAAGGGGAGGIGGGGVGGGGGRGTGAGALGSGRSHTVSPVAAL